MSTGVTASSMMKSRDAGKSARGLRRKGALEMVFILPSYYLSLHLSFYRSGNEVIFHNNVAYAASTSLANGKWIVAGGMTSNVAVIEELPSRTWIYKNGKEWRSNAVFIPGSGTVEEGNRDLPFRELPVATSHFCLVRLDQDDSMFMTGGSADPRSAWLFQ